jgi:hypothetical protein
MTRVLELGYLTEIQLLDKGIVKEPVAISGNELLEITKKEAPAYIEFVDKNDKSYGFNGYFEWALCGAWDIHDPEAVEYLRQNEGKSRYIQLMCDRKIDPQIWTGNILQAKYWMLGGENRGWQFRGGTETKKMKRNNMGYSLRNIQSLSDVRNDLDFWGWAETWLKKWRK